MKVFGLIGNPVGHSLSPPMHEAAYAELGVDARYVTFEPAQSELATALSGAAALGISGLNVTIPFKQAVLEFVEPAELAGRIGAINTIDFTTSPPRGYNTDAVGARRALEHHEIRLTDRMVLLVGAGGAGRAIGFGLADAGSRLAIANRTRSRADELASDIGEPASGHGLEDIPALAADADILINATSVGMEEDVSPVPASSLHADLTVMDVVYQPQETRLLRDAAARGAETIDGAWMLLFQGVEAFERWMDAEAPVAVMDAALRERL